MVLQTDEPKSKIDSLEKMLYSREGKLLRLRKRRLLRENFTAAPNDWEDSKTVPQVDNDMTRHKGSFFKKLLFFSALFFIASLVFGFFMFFKGGNEISAENIAVSILAPASIAGGEELPLDIEIVNRNNTVLESVALFVEYPSGTKAPENPVADLKRDNDSLGDILPGGTASRKFRAVLFGEENAEKNIVVTLEYRLKGSNAIFHKESNAVVRISSSPASLLVKSINEINSGQEFEIILEAVSNATSVLKNVLVKATYPFGFNFKGSEPQAVSSNSLWSLGDFPPGGKRTIKIRGTLEGQDGEERAFQFAIGTADPNNSRLLGTAFLTTSQKISLRRPFISADLLLDGDSSAEHVVSAARVIRAQIDWVNNLPTQVTDAVIEVKLSGALLDKSSVFVDSGYYRSSDNTIIWDKNSLDRLSVLNSGDAGRVSFNFKTYPLLFGSFSSARNPMISISVNVKGKRLSDTNVPENITAVVEKKIKIQTDLNLAARATYFVGPFKNNGPIPPKADTATTYTVTWSITNSANSVSHAEVRAKLPSYVTWLGVSAPLSEQVLWNSQTGEVVWDVGNVKADTGITSVPREVSFQLSLFPSLSQVGTAPEILKEAVLTGTDDWTGTSISVQKNALTTELPNDPNFTYGEQDVVR